MPVLRLVAVIVLVASTLSGASTARLRSHTTSQASFGEAAIAKAVDAANALLATLDDRQRARIKLPLNATTRTVWSNLPTGVTMQTGARERNGLKLGDLTPAQRAAALALVAAALSRDGYQKVMNIVAADQVLEEKTPPRGPTNAVRFGRAEFYVALLGTPSVTERWMLQFGGHHLAINVTVAARQSVLTPSHTGAQPATYTLDGQTVRPLGHENDKAFALVNTLDAAQRTQAILGYEVRNLVLGPGQDGKVIQPEGVRVSTFTANQRAKLLDLVGEWVNILNDEAAAAKLAEITRHLADTYFAWAGSTTNGSPVYFRVQGPTVLIEYAPQGSTDHIHTIYRDPTNDYGAKLEAR